MTTCARQLDETRALLGEHLALYQIHSATLESGVLDDDAVLGELASLRAPGWRWVSRTTGPGQADTIERALEVGGFDTVQAPGTCSSPPPVPPSRARMRRGSA